MKQAETYLELHAECPYCGEGQEVEWAFESCSKLDEATCDACGEEFTFCHPGNQYGLAR